MKVIIMLAVLASGNLFAKTTSCRDAVIKGQKLLGNSIAADDFSSRTFEEYNMTASEFNELDSEAQAEIYMQVKPLSVMVDETLNDLNRKIDYYLGSYYAYFMMDEIDEMRDMRSELRGCSEEE